MTRLLLLGVLLTGDVPYATPTASLSSPSGRSVIAVHAGRPYICWDLGAPDCVRELPLPSSTAWRAHFEAAGAWLANAEGYVFEVSRDSESPVRREDLEGGGAPWLLTIEVPRCGGPLGVPARARGGWVLVELPRCAESVGGPTCTRSRIRRPVGLQMDLTLEARWSRVDDVLAGPWTPADLRGRGEAAILVSLGLGFDQARTMTAWRARRSLARASRFLPRADPPRDRLGAAERHALEQIRRHTCGGLR